MTPLKSATLALTALAGLALSAGEVRGDDLYRDNSFAGIASDRKASQVGDGLSVLVFQAAEARNATRNASRRRSLLSGWFSSDASQEGADISMGSEFDGRGEVQRSDSLVAQVSVSIVEILPSGDFLVAGEQVLYVNGEETLIGVRGRVRPADISAENEVLSTRIADAEISYDGQGFVSRTSRPGLIHSLFSFLGLG